MLTIANGAGHGGPYSAEGRPAPPCPPPGSRPWAAARGDFQAAVARDPPHCFLCSPDQPGGGGAPSGEARAEQAGRGQVQEPEEGTDRFPAGGEHRRCAGRQATAHRTCGGLACCEPAGPQGAPESQAFGEKDREKALSTAQPSCSSGRRSPKMPPGT